MKKVLFIATVGVVLLSSCIKARTCTCTHPTSNPAVYQYNSASKSAQKADCESKDAALSGSGYSCSLD